MECEKPTKKYPNGRTGTYAGVAAHRKAGEELCAECENSRKEYSESHYERNKESIREGRKRRYWENREYELERAKRYHWENREYELERAKRYHWENRDQVVERKRTYYELNGWRLAAKYREENRERRREYDRRYHQENQGKYREHNRKRRTLKRGLPSEKYQEEDITRAHGKKCYLCEGEVDVEMPRGSPLSPQLDHVHPLSREGCPGDVIGNVRWTHAICNIKKGDKLVTDLPLPFVAPVGDEWNLVA